MYIQYCMTKKDRELVMSWLVDQYIRLRDWSKVSDRLVVAVNNNELPKTGLELLKNKSLSNTVRKNRKYVDILDNVKAERVFFNELSGYMRKQQNILNYRIWNKEKLRKRRLILKHDTAKKRMIVLQHYSKGVIQCACCGELIYEFLQIDHMNGRTSWGHSSKFSGRQLYDWLIKNDFPQGFQVLCGNCNFAKAKYHICPHQVIIKNTLFPNISK